MSTGAVHSRDKATSISSSTQPAHYGRVCARVFLLSLLCETPGNGRVRRNAIVARGLPVSSSTAHFARREAKDGRITGLVGRFTVSSTTRTERTTVRGPTTEHSHSTKKVSTAPVPPTPRRQNNDALRPLRHGAPALRAAAAPARPRPRLARRVGTIGSASLEGGGQPRALHAATR